MELLGSISYSLLDAEIYYYYFELIKLTWGKQIKTRQKHQKCTIIS